MKPIGQYIIEKGNLEITYKVVDDSFDHLFGTHRATKPQLVSAQYFIEEVNKWVDAEPIEARCLALTTFIEKVIDLDFERG